jgi:hypothetical protein
MLAGRARQAVRTLNSIGSFHSQIPVIGCSRSADRYAPCALPLAQGVLKLHSNLSAQLSVPEILQLNRDSHHMEILSKTQCPSAVQTGQVRGGWVFQRIMDSLIHKSC